MSRKIIFGIVVAVVVAAACGCFYQKTETPDDNAVNITEENLSIVEIPVDSITGISPGEAEGLCYLALGEKDKDTGFTFSFGTSGAVKRGEKKYYVIRASWLVNNSHMSYIGDFFVSEDGKEIYSGTALGGEYVIENLIWQK